MPPIRDSSNDYHPESPLDGIPTGQNSHWTESPPEFHVGISGTEERNPHQTFIHADWITCSYYLRYTCIHRWFAKLITGNFFFVTGPQYCTTLNLHAPKLYDFIHALLHIFYLVRSLKDWTAIFVVCISCSLNSLIRLVK